MIDVERVHDVLEYREYGPRCGRTTAMIVAALGYADFEGVDIDIICRNCNGAMRILPLLCRIAEEMGFEAVERIRKDAVRVNKRLYYVHSSHNYRPMSYLRRCFFDDLCFESRMSDEVRDWQILCKSVRKST